MVGSSAESGVLNGDHSDTPINTSRSSAAASSPGDLLAWAHHLADQGGFDLFVTDPASGRFIDCNRTAHERLGYSRAELLALGPAQIQAESSHDAVWVRQRIRQGLRGAPLGFRTQHRCRDGTALDVQVNHIRVEVQGQPVLLALVQDRSTDQQQLQQLRRQLNLVLRAEELHRCGGWLHELSSDRLRCSPQVERLLGCAPTHLGAYLQLVHPEDRERWSSTYQRALERGDRVELPHRLLLADQDVREVHLSGQTICRADGTAVELIATLADASAKRDIRRAMERARLQDPLTELPNKTATLEWLARQLNGRPDSANLAVLGIDIDGFQEINDSFGHDTGDRLLRAFAASLRSLLPPEAWLGRLSSDEFVVILHQGLSSFGEAFQAARALQLRLHSFDNVNGELPLRPTVSVGVSSYPEHGNDGTTLLQCANTAMMEAKRQGRGQLRAYSSTISRQIRERLVLDAALHKAITREQLRIVVQPQSDRQGRLAGGEVLLRWHDHHGVEVSPAFFIPLAEQSGLIFPISDWVLNATLDQVSHWRHRGLPVPRLALNISARLLESSDRRLAEHLHGALEQRRLPADVLELEITETALLRNPVAAAETVRSMADAGFRIAIDDFGTGYSSMDLLRNLPVHKLKIDTTFVRNIDRSPEDQAIVQATITLAHGLGMTCIAEGVETQEQRQILLGLGCDQFQGYLCGRPASVEHFTALLSAPLLPCTEGAEGHRGIILTPAEAMPAAIPLHGRSSSFDELQALRGMLDQSPDAFLLTRAVHNAAGEIIDFTVLEANTTSCDYMRQNREAVVGQTLCTLFPNVIGNGLLAQYVLSLQNQQPLELDDFAYANHEVYGETRIYDLRAYPKGNLLSLTWRDVTLRHARLRRLAAGATRLELLNRQLNEALLVVAANGTISWASARCTAITGWREEQLHGRPFRALFASAATPSQSVVLASWLQQPGDTGTRLLRMATPSGGWCWLDVSGRRCDDATPADGTAQEEPLLACYVLSLRPAESPD